MTADPMVTVAYFAVVLLVVCGVMAVVEGILERRERRAARDWNRAMRRRAS